MKIFQNYGSIRIVVGSSRSIHTQENVGWGREIVINSSTFSATCRSAALNRSGTNVPFIQNNELTFDPQKIQIA
jgi:hypothetical protein